MKLNYVFKRKTTYFAEWQYYIHQQQKKQFEDDRNDRTKES